MLQVNALGQPVGASLDNWQPAEWPGREPMVGRHCRLEPLAAAAHAAELHAAFAQDRSGANWTYLPYGPFADEQQFHAWVAKQASQTEVLFFAVLDSTSGRACGFASFLRIAPEAGSIEIGHIHFSPALQGSMAATEALYLMLQRVFRLGYRRCEWKCNALNQASRRAALRLGFRFEGVFRQAAVVKGRNRDTAWFSMLDREWQRLAPAFEAWLQPQNFAADGRQLQRLSVLTAECLADEVAGSGA